MVLKKFNGQNDIDMLNEGYRLVVHPLDDVHEEKVDLNALGAMTLKPAAFMGLVMVRGYILLSVGLVAFHVIKMAHIGL